MNELDTTIPIVEIDKYYNKLNGLVLNTEDVNIFKLWLSVVQNLQYQGNENKKINIDVRNNILNR